MNIEELKKKRIIDLTAEEFCVVLLDMQGKSQSLNQEVPAIFGIDICAQVTGISKATIYRNTSKKIIPHYLREGKLLFKRDEVYEWMTENRIETCKEFIDRMDEQMAKRLKK